jgi:hypothetical protein
MSLLFVLNTYVGVVTQPVKLMILIIFLKMHSGTKLYFFHFVFVFGGEERGGCQIPA